MKYLIKIIILLLFVSCAKEGKDGEDPFNPVYDLGLVAATAADLNNATILPSLFQGSLPTSFILNMPPVANQGNQGSCVGFAVGYATMSFNINRQVNGSYNTTQLASPKFLYNLSKVGGCQDGTNFPKALEILKTKGICQLAFMPYNDFSCSELPNSLQLNNALNYKISGWSYILLNNTNTIKKLIRSGYPVMVGIKAHESLGRYKSGVYNSFYGTNSGGHAVCIMGYNDSLNAYRIQNSWGSSWGDSGMFWIDYNFIQNIALESWCYIAIPAF